MKDNALSSYMKCPECINLGRQSVDEWLPAVENTVGRHSWSVAGRVPFFFLGL